MSTYFFFVNQRNQASNKQWTHLKGRFLLHAPFTKAVIFIEGPPAGIDILVDGLVLSPARKLQAAPCPKIEVCRLIASYSLSAFACLSDHVFLVTFVYHDTVKMSSLIQEYLLHIAECSVWS